MAESVEVQRLRQMLKAARPLLRELSIACARVEEELMRQEAIAVAEAQERLEKSAQYAQPQEAQHGQDNGIVCKEHVLA